MNAQVLDRQRSSSLENNTWSEMGNLPTKPKRSVACDMQIKARVQYTCVAICGKLTFCCT